MKPKFGVVRAALMLVIGSGLVVATGVPVGAQNGTTAGYTTSGATTTVPKDSIDADGDGIPDVLADRASRDKFTSCHVGRKYKVGVPEEYRVDDIKSKFDRTKPIRLGMFSTVTLLYSGPWPSNDIINITIPSDGLHRFVVFGTSTAGKPTYAGCMSPVDPVDSTGATSGSTSSGTTSNSTGSTGVLGTAQPSSRTGAHVQSIAFLGGALIIVGGLLVLFVGRRRREAATT